MDFSSAYHFRDSELLSQFMADLSRETLLIPIKKDNALRNRCFKGMRIGGGKPTLQQFTKKYQKQIVEHRDIKLATYLCMCWCFEKKLELVRTALECLGVNEEPSLKDGLMQINERVASEGHEQSIGTLLQNLSFDYDPEDLEILAAIICANVADPATVREYVQTSSRFLKSDPSEVIRNLRPKVENILRLRQGLKEKQENREKQRQETTDLYEKDLQKLDDKTASVKDLLATTNAQIEELELKIKALQESIRPLKCQRSEQVNALERAGRSQDGSRMSYEKEIFSIDQDLESIRVEYEKESKTLTEYQVLIADAEARIEKERAKSNVARTSEVEAGSRDIQEFSTRQPIQSEFLESLIENEKTGNFTSSSASLEILSMLSSGCIKKGSQVRRRQANCLTPHQTGNDMLHKKLWTQIGATKQYHYTHIGGA